MALGYVIAALLEAAGFLGLVFALIKIGAERRARAAELRSFLRSGQSASTLLGSAHRRSVRVVAVLDVTGRERAGPPRDSAARSALRRAVARGGQQFPTDRTMPISAG